MHLHDFKWEEDLFHHQDPQNTYDSILQADTGGIVDLETWGKSIKQERIVFKKPATRANTGGTCLEKTASSQPE